MQGLDGPAAIGHVRYATCGGDDRSYAQPFEREHGRKAKWFAFAFNGQLANYQELKRRAARPGRLPPEARHRHRDPHALAEPTSSRTRARRSTGSGVFGRLAERFDGAYNIVLLTAIGDLVVARDPLGFRPLCIAEHGPLFAAASESVPLANLGFRNIRSLEPGHAGGRQPRRASGSSGSPPRPGRPTASSSGSTSPTSPARSTTARST